jgi:hypothetical protein
MNMQMLRMIVVTALVVLQVSMIGASPQKPNKLYNVKKIYVCEYEANDKAAEIETRRKSDLRKELLIVGFEIVDDARDADAILNEEIQAEVVIDGPQPDPPRYIYEFKLTLPNNDVAWHTKFNVRSRLKAVQVNEQAAKRFTQRLLEDWLKSAKKAGLIVGDKVS